MAQTQHVWTASKFERILSAPDAATVAIRAKVEEFLAAGKQIGEATVVEDPANDQFTSTRTFVDRATADEWAAFMDQFGPISVTVTD
jgi:hypothetical protein